MGFVLHFAQGYTNKTRNLLAKQTWRAAAGVRKRLTCSTSHRLQGVTSATLCACLRRVWGEI